MFFLLRTAFWLSLVIVLIPAGEPDRESAQPNISTLQALGAAQQTYVDMTRFCERNQTACDTGGAALEIFGAKARNGARMIYQYLDPEGRTPDQTATGSIATGTAENAPAQGAYPAAQPVQQNAVAPVDTGTLTASDRAPAWVPPLPQDKPA